MAENIAGALSYIIKFRIDQGKLNRALDDLDGKVAGLNKSAQNLGRIGFQAVAAGAAVASAAMAKLAVDTVKVGANFENAMYVLASIRGVAVKNLKPLEDQARMLGATTLFTATQAAEGMQQLARAGLEVNEIVLASGDALAFAGANFVSMNQATTLTAATMKQFNIQAHDAARITDTMTTAAQNSLFNVEGLATAMRYGGSAGSSLGATLEETVSMLAQFRDLGLESSMAGVRFRQSMLALSAPTYKAKKALEALGIGLDEVNPRVVGLEGAFKRLGKAGLTADQLVPIVNKISAADVAKISGDIYRISEASDDATGSVGAMVKKIEESRGVTKRTYEMVKASTVGQFQILKSAFQELQLTIFDTLKGGPTGTKTEFKAIADVLGNLKLVIDDVTTVIRTQGDYISKEFSEIFGDMAGSLKKNSESIAASLVQNSLNALKMVKNFAKLVPLIWKVAKALAGLYISAKFQAGVVALLEFIAVVAKLIPVVRRAAGYIALMKGAMAGPAGLAIAAAATTATIYAFDAALKEGTESTETLTDKLKLLKKAKEDLKEKTKEGLNIESTAQHEAASNLQIQLHEQGKLTDVLEQNLNALKNVTAEEAAKEPEKYWQARINIAGKYTDIILDHAAATRLDAAGIEGVKDSEHARLSALTKLFADIKTEQEDLGRIQTALDEQTKESWKKVNEASGNVKSMWMVNWRDKVLSLARGIDGVGIPAVQRWTEIMEEAELPSQTRYHDLLKLMSGEESFTNTLQSNIEALEEPMNDAFELSSKFQANMTKADKDFSTKTIIKATKKTTGTVKDLNKELKKLLDKLKKLRDEKIKVQVTIEEKYKIAKGELTEGAVEGRKGAAPIVETAKEEADLVEAIQDKSVSRRNKKSRLSEEQRILKAQVDAETLSGIYADYIKTLETIEKTYQEDQQTRVEEQTKAIQELKAKASQSQFEKFRSDAAKESEEEIKSLKSIGEARIATIDAEQTLIEDLISRGATAQKDIMEKFFPLDLKIVDPEYWEGVEQEIPIDSFDTLQGSIKETRKELKAAKESGDLHWESQVESELEQMLKLRKMLRGIETEKEAQAFFDMKRAAVEKQVYDDVNTARFMGYKKAAELMKQENQKYVKALKEERIAAEQEGDDELTTLYREFLATRSEIARKHTEGQKGLKKAEEENEKAFVAKRKTILQGYYDEAGKMESKHYNVAADLELKYLEEVESLAKMMAKKNKTRRDQDKIEEKQKLVENLAANAEYYRSLADLEKRRKAELQKLEALKLKIDVDDEDALKQLQELIALINHMFDMEAAGLKLDKVATDGEEVEKTLINQLSLMDILTDDSLPNVLALWGLINGAINLVSKSSNLLQKAISFLLYKGYGPLIKTVVGGLKDIWGWTKKNSKEFGKWVKRVLKIGVWKSFKNATVKAFKSAGQAFAGFANKIPGVKDDFKRVSQEFKGSDWAKKSFWQKLGSVFKGIGAGLAGIVKVIAGGGLKAGGDMLKSMWGKLGKLKIKDFVKLWSTFSAVALGAFKLVGAGLGKLVSLVKSAAEMVSSGISYMTGGLNLNLLDLFQGGANAVLEDAEKAAERLKELDDKLAAGEITQEEYDEARAAGVGDPDAAAAAANYIDETIDKALDFIDAIVAAAPVVVQKLIEKIPELVNALVNGIPVVLQALMQGIVPVLKSIVDGLGQLIPVLIEVIVTELPNLVALLIDVLVNSLPVVIDALLEGIAALVQAFFVPTEAGAKSLFQELIEAVGQILGKLIGSIGEALVLLIAEVPNIIKTILEQLPKLITSLLAGIELVLAAVLEALPVLIEYILLALPDLLAALLEGLLKIIILLVGKIPVLVTKLLEMLPKVVSKFVEMALQFVLTIIKKIPEIIKAFIDALPELIRALIVVAPDLAIAVVVALIEALPQIAVELIKLIIFELPPLAIELIKAIVEGIATGVIDLVRSIKNLFSDLISEVITFGIAETETFGDTPGAIQAGTDGLVARFAAGDYVIAAQDPSVAAAQAMDLLTAGTTGAIARGITPLVNNLDMGVSVPEVTSQNPINIAVVAEGRVLDSIQVNAMNRGHAPKLKRKLRTASGVKTGFSKGKYNKVV